MCLALLVHLVLQVQVCLPLPPLDPLLGLLPAGLQFPRQETTLALPRLLGRPRLPRLLGRLWQPDLPRPLGLLQLVGRPRPLVLPWVQ